jgi:hypothetical protein
MEKLRRKLTDRYGNQKMRTVWKCYCKIAYGNGTIGYFFEQPVLGAYMDYVHFDPDPQVLMYKRAMRVAIDEVREDGMVFCSKI